MDLRTVYEQCFQSFRKFQSEGYVVQESMPIAYFGDLFAYQQSKQRIVTVGLNPSNQEFPSKNSYLRFSSNQCISYQQIIENKNYQLYESLLCQYYKNQHCYMRWFNSFENILQGMNASYREDYNFDNRVLHTDICSPIATNPTWSRIELKSKQDNLLQDGKDIWHDLIRLLKPDLIIISVARRYLNLIQFEQISDFQVIYKINNKKNGEPRKKVYEVKLANYQISDDFTTLICFGEAANTPFGSISNQDKLFIGQKLLQKLAGTKKVK